MVLAVNEGTIWHVVSFAFFGSSLIALYLSSSLYHLLRGLFSLQGVSRKIDHLMIFVLIAGSYAPFCLVTLRGAWGWSVFGVILSMALLGFFRSFFWINAPRWAVSAMYLFMGWVAVVGIYPLYQRLPPDSFAWLVAGGIFYSIGAIIYALQRPNPWRGVFGFHEVWHLFVLCGSLSHYLSVIFLLKA